MRGHYLSLSPSRRLIADLSWLAEKVPIGVLRSTIDISPLLAARTRAPERPPLTIAFAKAVGIVAQEIPELRRAYTALPWPRLHEAPVSVASIMIERLEQGEPAIFPLRIVAPETRSLAELAGLVANARTAPLDEIKRFRFLLRISRLPLPLRRLLWLWTFNTGGGRLRYFGTFGMSVLGHLGVEIIRPVSPLSLFISYGPIREDGRVELLAAFDHRAMDGGHVARAMERIAAILNGPIVEEIDGAPEV